MKMFKETQFDVGSPEREFAYALAEACEVLTRRAPNWMVNAETRKELNLSEDFGRALALHYQDWKQD